MTEQNQILPADISREERYRLRLQAMYRRHGYSRFKLDKFEEYELYLRNRDFIETENIIVFNDLNGRLLALKPDLTLSIVKNYRPQKDAVSKVFYSENVYRYQRESRTHREMLQTGLECLGAVDAWQVAEVTTLAAMSLEAVTDEYVLEVSHMGIVMDLLRGIKDDSVRQDLVRLIGARNRHEAKKVLAEAGAPEGEAAALGALFDTYGTWEEAKTMLDRLPLTASGREAAEELNQTFSVLRESGLDQRVRVDFSVVNDLNYYSGIVFRGFVRGVPHAILSGGRYDKLMERMGKPGGAIGFAVYLDYLERLMADRTGNDVDVVLLYEKGDRPEEIGCAVREIQRKGESVLAARQVPRDLKVGKVVRLTDTGKGGRA